MYIWIIYYKKIYNVLKWLRAEEKIEFLTLMFLFKPMNDQKLPKHLLLQQQKETNIRVLRDNSNGILIDSSNNVHTILMIRQW